MKAVWLRFLLTAALFLGWIGYLAYLVANRPLTPDEQPLVLSRAQLLASDIDVIAHVEAPDQPVRIVKVLWLDEATLLARAPERLRANWPALKAMLAEGRELKVENLGESQARAAGPEAPDPKKDFSGPGEYLIPLSVHLDSKSLSVLQVPESPGLTAPPRSEEDIQLKRVPPKAWLEKTSRWPIYRIYPATDEALAQYAKIKPTP